MVITTIIFITELLKNVSDESRANDEVKVEVEQ